MKNLKRIISLALVFTIMASFTVIGTKAAANDGLTDFITSDTDIDAILKTPYVDAVPTAHSELLFATHSGGYGFDKDSVYNTGATVSHDMMIDLSVNGSNLKPANGYYYPSHTALEDNHKSDDGFINLAPDSKVSATYTYGENVPERTKDGIICYTSNTTSHWATWKSPNNSDVLTYEFNNVYEVNSINIHYFTDYAGTPVPSEVVIKYWNGSEYVEVPNVKYPAIADMTANVCTFDMVITDSIAIEFTRAASNKGMGVTEVEIYGKPLTYYNIASCSTVSASYYYSYGKPENTIDGVVSYTDVYNRWASWKSPNNTDTLTYDFDTDATIDKINVYYLTDHGGTLFPGNVAIKYWNGTEYVAVENATYPEIVEQTATTYTFDAVTTNSIAIELTRPASNKGMAVGEVEIFGELIRNIAPYSTVASTYYYSYTSGSGSLVAYTHDNTIDGVVSYTDVYNRWASWKSPNNTDTLTYNFDYNAKISKINVYYLTDHGGTLFPGNVVIKYWNGTEYIAVENATYPEIVEQTATTYTFDEVTTDSIVIELTRPASNKGMAVGEVEIFGKPIIYSSVYDVTVSEEKFITTSNVATSVITVTNNSDKDAEVAIDVTNTRGVTTDYQDNLYTVIDTNGGTRRRVVLEAGQSREFISTLAFAKTEAEARANGKAVIEDTDRLEHHKAEYHAWFKKNVPYFECDDPQITQTYYFRWLTYRNHIRLVPNDMYIVTEFMPNIYSWSGTYNSIVAAIPHEFSEGRWVKDNKYLDSYMDFWFETEGVKLTGYTNSMANSYYAYYLANGNKDKLTKHLDNLISVYNTWENKTSSENAYFDADTGLYFVKNGYDAMEYSLSYKIGGTDAGYRPTVNSDMYGDALAIAKIATLAGKTDIAEQYFAKAETLKESIQEKMWDAEDGMFETYDLGDGDTIGVKELVGYLPWYYNMPDDTEEYSKAWQYLADENTFYGVYGLATGDKSHPDYNTYYTDASLNRITRCNWDGSSWPFGTTQTLVAAANALNNYENAGLSADDYYKTLKAYTNGQFKNGYSWIAENRDADEDKWYIDHASRSYHYNHSAYADLIITGLVGIRPADNDDTLVINPLVPENTLSSFVLENVQYRGNNITVVYDKNGDKYGVGAGLTVYVDGEVAAASDTLSKQTVSLTKAPVLTCENGTVTLSGKARRVYWGYIGSENTEYTWFDDFKAQAGDTFTSEYAPKADDKYTMTKAGFYRFVVNYIDDGKSVDLVFTFENRNEVATPEITVDGNYAVISDNATKLYYGYIGTENTPYTTFDTSVLTEADYDVKSGDRYVMEKAGYYRFVVVFNLDGKMTEKVCTVYNQKDGGKPFVAHADGKITLSDGGVKVNKMYIAYNGEEAVEIDNWTDYCNKAIARACYLTPADQSEYTLKNSGCYTVLVNYFNGTKNVDVYFTVKN